MLTTQCMIVCMYVCGLYGSYVARLNEPNIFGSMWVQLWKSLEYSCAQNGGEVVSSATGSVLLIFPKLEGEDKWGKRRQCAFYEMLFLQGIAY